MEKNNDVIEALGQIDELNSALGLAIEHCKLSKIPDENLELLYKIQNNLFDIGSHIATPRSSEKSKEASLAMTVFDEKHIDTLEKEIDLLDS